ncbi:MULTISPECIES: AraC family transcriptional regulator [Nocardiaceae]|jgi:AraC-like DNA-binding protein|uniref:AraC family transcriptional regulator n=1 Tax=Nocardiaceae TaxID=85025 RepID=UPI0005658CC6|nr:MULTISPECIES: AraC family transcriptional regulator [Rhodococcus]OZE91301.1 AraC family transcriptional regulator [Rhodococcus sp. 15-1189-1-1a]OZF15589.1 AraC family transcriptional regulator [Rhodococcus sp. 14-2686-1-2]
MASNDEEAARFPDWEHVHEAVADAYFPHEMHPLTAGAEAAAAVGSADLGTCRITHIQLGAEVSVSSDHPGAYGINIPVSGSMTSSTNGVEVISGVGQATACPPDALTVIPQWETSCRIVGFKIDEAYLHTEMERILDRPASPVPLQLDLTAAGGQSWLRLVRSVYEQVREDDALLHNDLMRRQLAGVLTTGFVLATVDDVSTGRSGTRPRIVRRVVSAIDDDPARAWTPGEMCAIAGVSVRRLQQGFREYVGMTPFEYLNSVRLERARAELLAAQPPTTVLDVASSCGITHTGRFAAAYRRRYGELPSTTLAH